MQLSTDYAFAGDKLAPYVEAEPVGLTGANPRHAILRTAWVYSPSGENFVKTMLRFGETPDELSVVDDQCGNPTSAHDIAEGLWHLARQVAETPSVLAPGVYHMSAVGEASLAEFAEEIFRVSAALGSPSARVRRTTAAKYPTLTLRPANSRLDCRKLGGQFGLFLPQWQASAKVCAERLIKNRDWAS